MQPIPVKVAEQFYRGPAPMSQKDLEFLWGQGVRTIICVQEGFTDALRGLWGGFTSRAARAWWEEKGGKYWRISFSNIFPPTQDEACLVMGLVQGAQLEGGVYLHCRRGKDRTGFLCSFWRWAMEGLPAEEAWAYAARMGQAWHYRVLWKGAFLEACKRRHKPRAPKPEAGA